MNNTNANEINHLKVDTNNPDFLSQERQIEYPLSNSLVASAYLKEGPSILSATINDATNEARGSRNPSNTNRISQKHIQF